MADFVYNIAKFQVLGGDIDLSAGGDDIRVLLLESATDENKDDTTITAVLARAGTTELTSTGYSRQALANEATSQDDTDDEGVFDADNVTFSGVSQAGSEDAVACVVYKHVTNDGDSVPLIFIDSGFPVTPNGSDITISWAAEGILNLNDA
jgi:hypothetical protein